MHLITSLLFKLSFLFMLTVSQNAGGADSTVKPISIQSKSVKYIKSTSKIAYRGNVIIKQSPIVIRASHAVATERKGQIQSLRLTGNPVIFRQGKETLKSNILYYQADINHVTAKGKNKSNRVHATFFPKHGIKPVNSKTTTKP